MADVKLNLYQKISEITGALGAIQKDAAAPQAMGGYKFLSHGAVLAHLRHELTARNVVIHPSGEELLHHEAFEKRTVSNNAEKISYNFHSVIKYKFTVVDGDNPSDSFEDSWIGEGMDSSDKGIQKAGTSAEKYYLMKLFKIGDKDDPDAIDAGAGGVVSQSASFNKPPIATSAAPAIPATDLKPTEVMAQQLAANGNAAPNVPTSTELDPKIQLENLFWLGEELNRIEPKSGWFRGKVNAKVFAYESRKKSNTLTPAEAEAGSGIVATYNEVKAAHVQICGADCDHVKAYDLATRIGGAISEEKV